MTRLIAVLSLILMPLFTQPAHAEADQVVIRDIVVGNGDAVTDGARVVVQYAGFLTDGTPFDSSYVRGVPFSFHMGAAEVIQGWEVGLKGMRVGGRRELTIPPSLGYGERGAGDVVPPNATLVFEIELLKVEAPKFKMISIDEMNQAKDAGGIIVDIRTDSQRATGTIPGAMELAAFDETGKLNRAFMAKLLRRANKTDIIVLVDEDGKQAQFLGRFLAQSAGFNDLFGLEGGMKAWRKKSQAGDKK